MSANDLIYKEALAACGWSVVREFEKLRTDYAIALRANNEADKLNADTNKIAGTLHCVQRGEGYNRTHKKESHFPDTILCLLRE